MTATQTALRMIDKAGQLFGARGVTLRAPVETLYRDIRALRIYEGATKVQKLIIARELLATNAAHRALTTDHLLVLIRNARRGPVE